MTGITHATLEMVSAKTSAVFRTRWKWWLALVAIAVIGSCLYGASLSLVLRDWKAGAAALWLAVSAGLAWCVFIPVLWRTTRLPLLECLDRCLVTMAAGEVILTSGALVNLLLWHAALLENAAPINAVIVAISNVAMFIILAAQMRSGGVAVWKTLTLWMLALNGSGALFFWLLYRRLHGA